MRQVNKEYREVQWRVKLFFGLVLLGAFLGAMAWVWQDLGGSADAVSLTRILWQSRLDWRFWVVMAACASLGGWLAFLLTRSRVEQDGEHGQDVGKAGPRF